MSKCSFALLIAEEALVLSAAGNGVLAERGSWTASDAQMFSGEHTTIFVIVCSTYWQSRRSLRSYVADDVALGRVAVEKLRRNLDIRRRCSSH